MLALPLVLGWLGSVPASAQSSSHATIGFQGRLLMKNGTPVEDGTYNMQFKIYQGGDGTKPGNPGGALVWSESYLNNSERSGVSVKNGRFAVQLGSAQPFTDAINWSAGNLWFSMNVAGSSICHEFGGPGCTADGEMLPMKRISGSPYAMSAGKLGDKTADDFVQIGGGKQTDSSTGSSIFLDKTGNGHLIRLQNNGKDSFTVTNSGDIKLGSQGDRSIALESRKDTGASLTLKAGDSDGSQGGSLVLSGGDAGGESGNGGNIVLKGGSGSKNDVDGLVIIGTPTFSTTVSDTNCRPEGKLASDNCQITDKSINTSAAIIIGFSSEGKTARVPDPAIKTPGRIIYLIGASDSAEFTLQYGKDTNASIIMQPDTATSLLWNGSKWTPIGPQAATPASEEATPGKDNEKDSKDTTGTPSKKTPDASADSATEGSMYYDDELGKIRCYQLGEWDDCAAAPDAFITISPEYSGAVMNGADLGTISSDLCSDALNINDGSDGQSLICDKDETYNYYQWSTSEEEPQTRSIYLTYKLPANFKQFVPETTSLTTRRDGDTAGISYQLYRSQKTENLEACGEAVDLDEKPGSWHILKAVNEADPANCDFQAGDSLLIRINLTATATATAYVSDIDFVYSSQ